MSTSTSDSIHNTVWTITFQAFRWAKRYGRDPVDTAMRWVADAGFDPKRELVWGAIWDAGQDFRAREIDRLEPDSELNKYACRKPDHLVRRRLRALGIKARQATERRRCGGYPQLASARVRRDSGRRTPASSSRAGPSDSEPGEPEPPGLPRLAAGRSCVGLR